MPSWTFKSKKVSYCVRNVSVFLNCCWSFTEKNWNFLRKRHGRVAKTAFYVSRGTIFGKTFFLGKLFSFQFLIVKEKIMTPAKVFSEGCLKSTLRFQLIAFTINFFLKYFYFSIFFGPQAEKISTFDIYFFKAVNVHSTYWDDYFSEKKFFLEKTIKFHPFWTWKQKYFENFWKLSEKKCLHWIIKCLKERYNWILFFFEFFFCILFPDFDRKNIKKLVETLW